MGNFRRLLAQRHLTTLICVVAMLLKLLVPSGYMLAADHGRITMAICSGVASSPITISMPMRHDDSGGKDHHGRDEMPCPYGSLAFPALQAVDPIQLALLMAFILAVGVVVIAPAPRASSAFLQPPPRGPPASL